MAENYITGASGFIGKRLMAALGNSAQAIPHQHIDSWNGYPCDTFYFLSSYGNLAIHDLDHSKIIKANVSDAMTIAAQLMKFGCRRFIYVSSSSVLLPVQTVYSAAKRAAEDALFRLSEIGLPVVVVRPYSVTGVGEHECHLIPTLIRSCKQGLTMKLVCSPCHDYIDVEDLVSGLIASAQMPIGFTLTLGSGRSVDNASVAKIVQELVGKQLRIEISESIRKYDTTNWKDTGAHPDGWSAKKTLEMSVSEMVKCYD